MSFTADDVFIGAAALLNDTVRAVFTNTVQMPYLNIAILDLKRKLELNNIPVSNDTSAVIAIPDGTETLAIGGATPCLPSDLIEIKELYQRPTGTQDQFLPVQKYSFLPKFYEGVEQPLIPAWAWYRQIANFVPANVDLDLKVDYVADIIPAVDDAADTIDVLNALGYLQYRTAGHCANYIGSNPTRAADLYGMANEAFDEILGIGSKGKQSIATRRRPFRAGFRNRGVVN